jgi:hypothetical protein
VKQITPKASFKTLTLDLFFIVPHPGSLLPNFPITSCLRSYNVASFLSKVIVARNYTICGVGDSKILECIAKVSQAEAELTDDQSGVLGL